MSMNLSDIADYRCIMSNISKNEAISLMQNTNLDKKSRNYKT